MRPTGTGGAGDRNLMCPSKQSWVWQLSIAASETNHIMGAAPPAPPPELTSTDAHAPGRTPPLGIGI